jgi:sugar/nucleoside kinase (ribokinase family)
MNTYDVYGVGNALVDIQVQVDTSFLSDHKIDKGVMTLVSAESQFELLKDLKGLPKQTSSGGSACNTVVGVANYGGRAYYAGKVGQDKYGEFYQNELKELGIRSDLPPAQGSTGTCLVMITPDADRTMLTCLADSIKLSGADILDSHVKNAGYVYVEGYLWDSEGPREASIKAMEIARKNDVKVAYTYSDPFCVQRAAADFRALSKSSVDLVFCNEDEAKMITETDTPTDACLTIASWGPKVYMTVGAKGAYYADGDQITHIPGFPATAIDTTGAGDLFAGGVLFGLSNGHSPIESGRLGSYAASLVVAQVGARLPQRLNGAISEILASRTAGA